MIRNMPGVINQLPSGKTNNYGIEAVSQLAWTGWEPGKEYTKNIVLKNVRVKTQKLKFLAPKSRFFTTIYPQPVMLSAGNTFSLPVTFRPLEKITYEDCIEFATNEGHFFVTVKAMLPQYTIDVPPQVMFGLCAVSDSVRTSFEIRNSSELCTPFQVSTLEPFTVEQFEGVLQPFTSQKLTATFRPKAATVYECEAVIRYGLDLVNAVNIRLIGLGKYPRLTVTCCGIQQNVSNQLACYSSQKEMVINYGTVPVGQTVEAWFEITNQSEVNARFKVDYPLALPCDKRGGPPAALVEQRTLDRSFHCKQKKGSLAPSKSLKIQIPFTPKNVGRTYTEYFHVQAVGNPSLSVIKCIASCAGPELVFSQGVMNFHLVMSGEMATKALDIINKSDVDAAFQFDIDSQESVFKLDLLNGIVPANSQKTILVHFKPVFAMNYYRRVICLVHNQGALTLELLGTCHTETEKPAVLQPVHIHRYQLYVERELSFIPPECLNAMLAEGKLDVDSCGSLYSPEQKSGSVSTELSDVIPAMDEYFNDGFHSDIVLRSPHVSMDVNVVDFGNVVNLTSVNQQTISLTNHTQGKVTVVWTGTGRVFSVSPTSVDIPSLKSASFQVTFKPVAVDQIYSAELEFYAQYKSMRDYCLTDDKTHFPPWCLTLTATGQTFQPKSEAFLPRFDIDPKLMAMSVVNEHDANYRTVHLANSGSTPILYNATKDSNGPFSLKPLRGVVPIGGHQIFVVKFSPPSGDGRVMQHSFQLRFNDSDKYSEKLVIYGSIESPDVKLDNGGVMYFKPTCVGTVCSRQYSVQNLSRLPVCFEWKLKHSDSMVVEVHPAIGVLQPNEIQYHEWFFKPNKEDKYVFKPVLAAWSSVQPGYRQKDGKVKQFTLRVIGEGASGKLSSKETCIDAGPLVIGTTTYRHLTLVNDSVCSLRYKLCVEQSVCGPYTDDGRLYCSTLGIELSATEGVLAARASCDILLTIRPSQRVSYRWKISYTLHTSDAGDNSSDSDATPSHLCDVLATGVYPTVIVTDAHCYGSAAGLSKKQLWSLFSIDNFNMFLDGDPSARELIRSAPTRHSYEHSPPVYTRAIVDFNFSAAPVGSESCIVQLQLENNCPVPCDWAFLFPSDQQLELEYWAESGEFDSTELHEMKVMDNKLFSVEPSKGKLLPGETCSVTLTYKHTMIGTDRLPVLLKLTRGREILLNFVGVTVDVDRPYIHFPSARHMFAPVPIGETRSPTQIYELYNGGAVPVSYEIDLTPLRTVFQENYGHAVFECLNPTGCISPGQTAAIEWKFSPLEARTYMVDITISMDGGEQAVVTFTGIGFDKRLMGSTMQLTDDSSQTGVPSVQSVPVPGQVCFLSQERISLGNVPLLASVRRIVTLRNTSAKQSVRYVWHVTNESHSQFVTVYPRADVLQPGESTLCKVTFYAVGQPAFFDIDLICETVFETEYNEYLEKLSSWEAERQRQMVEFTITEKDIDADLRLPSPEERPSSGRLKALSRSNTSSETEIIKYKALPPIVKQSVSTEDLRAAQKMQKRFEDHFWPKPCPPKQFMLHLGITARTHDIAEFREHFPDEYKRFFVDRTLCDSERDSSSTNQTSEVICCQQAEADMLSLVLQNIIRSLIDDAQFHEACHQLSNDKIPYFRQFAPADVKPNEDDIWSCRSPSAVTDVNDSKVNALQLDDDNQPTQQTEESNRSTNTPLRSLKNSHQSLKDVVRESESPTAAEFGQRSPSSASDVPSFHENENVNELKMTPSQEQLVRLAEANMEERNFVLVQQIKKQPEFGNFLESCLENTLINIIEEAFRHEFNITARPRLVALPPRPGSARNDSHLRSSC